MQQATICPIWGTPAEVVTLGHSSRVNSARTDGKYQITDTAMAMLPKVTPREKASLTSWIIQQHELGVEEPRITSDTINLIKSVPRMPFSKVVERLLRFTDRNTEAISDTVDVEHGQAADALMAWTGTADQNELYAVLTLVQNMGLISHIPFYNLTPLGYAQLEELSRQVPLTTQAFVAMWFDETMTAAYVNGIEPAIRESGYTALRVDQKEHINKIDDEIISEIRRSRFVVADFTSHEGVPRGGVYFEAGFAHGLGIPVIWTCRSDLIDSVHFDTRQFNHITWTGPEDLHTKLRNRIRAVIGQGVGRG